MKKYTFNSLHGNPEWQTFLCCSLLKALFLLLPFTLHATPLSCPVEHRVSVDFENGAGWDLCWESKRRENIVLSEVHYRTANNKSKKVVSSMRLAQLHVTYDDSNITYNDVTQFGLGGGYVAELSDAECPDGELIDVNGKPGMCKRVTRGDDAYRTMTESRLTEALTLFSVSQIGAYSYLVNWKLSDDGSIAPSVGAAGALQRSSDNPDSLYGRELEGVKNKSWLSHTHNYYWRVDFDLGESSVDDIVSEVTFKTDSSGRRVRSVERLKVESARKIDPTSMRAWHITDKSADVLEAPGYVIEPLSYGHKLVRTLIEPFTDYDFFVTRQNDCERFISENSKFNPGCGDDVLDFVDNESLLDQDIVIWHRVSFHHVPRNEDRYHMHSHWDGFAIKARNLSKSTPGHSGVVENSPPALAAPAQLVSELSEQINFSLLAADPDGDDLTFTAVDLPEGVNISAAGVLQGTTITPGNYRSVISVTDKKQTSSALIQWQISGAESSGGSGAVTPILLFLVCLCRAAVVREKFSSSS